MKIVNSLFISCMMIFLISCQASKVKIKYYDFAMENIRQEVQDTTYAIQEYGEIDSEWVGDGASTTEQWYRRKWLIKNATNEELLRLTEYPNDVVKAIAYEGLLRNDTINQFEIAKKGMLDSSVLILYVDGCMGDYYIMAEYIMDIVFEFYYYGEKEEEKYHMKTNLTTIEKQSLCDLYEDIMKREDFYPYDYIEKRYRKNSIK